MLAGGLDGRSGSSFHEDICLCSVHVAQDIEQDGCSLELGCVILLSGIFDLFFPVSVSNQKCWSKVALVINGE